MNKPATDANGDPSGMTLRELLSTHNKELEINDQVVAQAEADAPKSGYETRQFYTLAVDSVGKPVLKTADATDMDASVASNIRASQVNSIPERTGYTGYLVGDGFPVNGYEFGFGIQFPATAVQDDFFLRTDFLPNRLFRFDSTRWIKVEDAVRMTMTNTDTRSTLKSGFTNNTNFMYTDVVATDYVRLVKGDTLVSTVIPANITAPYVVLKLETTKLEYALADYPDLIAIAGGVIQIELPVINLVQQEIPYDGSWAVTLYNVREEERQSLSKALKPKADL